jgi:hypothetical protein
MAIVTRAGFAALLASDIWELVEETGKERPMEFVSICNEIEMDMNPIKMQQAAGLGTMPNKPEGTPFPLDQPYLENTKTVTAVPLGMAVEFTWEAWRDELYGFFRDMAKEMGRSSRYAMELDGVAPLNNGFSTGTIGFNAGESLLSTAHTSPTTGTAQANRPSPDIGFSVTGLQAGLIAFHRMKNDRDIPQTMFPEMAIIDPFNLFAAREILGSSGKPLTGNNEVNSLIPDGLRYFVHHYLSTQTYWYLKAPQGQHRVMFAWRDHPIDDSYDDPSTKNAVFTRYQRHTSFFDDWRGWYGSTG